MKRAIILGFTLIETLVAIVIGVISVAALFYSYQFFNKSYKGVIEKASISKSGRNGLSQIARELRNAGYKDIHFATVTSNHGGKKLTEYLLKENNNASTGGDILKFYYDFSPRQRVGIGYKLKKYKNRSDTFLARTSIFTSCTDPNQATSSDLSHLEALVPCKDTTIDNAVFIDNVEDFQVVFKNDKGVEVKPVNFGAGKSNQALVKSIELYITIKSKDEIFNEEKSWTISTADHSYTKIDKYHRDTLFVSVYPRNIVKN